MRILDILQHLNKILAAYGNVEAKIAIGIKNPERHEIVGILPMELRDKGEAYLPFLTATYDDAGNLILENTQGPVGPTGPTGQLPIPPVTGDSTGYQDIKPTLEQVEAEANVNISAGLAALKYDETFYTSANPGDFPNASRDRKQASFTFYREKDLCVDNAPVGRTVYECQIKPLLNIVKATEPAS